MGLQAEGLISGGGGGGAYKWNKKNVLKRATVVLIETDVFKLKSQNKATFNPVQYCHPAEGAYIRGGGGGAYNRMYFLFPVTWAYNRGGANKWGGGGLITGILRY